MKFRTLALALALSCGLTAIGEAKQKPVNRSKPYKATKAKKFKPAKHSAKRQIVKRRTVKH